MSDLFVKIDGLRELIHVQAAVEAGADAVGFIFAPARRYVSPDRVAEIVRDVPSSVKRVGVFVNESAANVRAIITEAGLDYAQLCGDESVEYCRDLGIPAIKSLPVRGDNVADDVARYADVVEWCILDGFQPNAYGGTGTSFDWTIATRVADRYPVMVAGGLTPENVGSAIRIARPWGVDVSSGVEVNGQKDVMKIQTFVAAARAAQRQLREGSVR